MNLIEGGRPQIGLIRRQAIRRFLPLSLEEGHPSMGKIVRSSSKKRRRRRAMTKALGKRRQLACRKRMQEALQQHRRFAQARIQVVVCGVQPIPLAVRADELFLRQVFGGSSKTLAQMTDKLGENVDFMQEARPAAKQHPAKQIIYKCRALRSHA